MSINRTNYEIFFLDYYEGNLKPEQVEELMAFLEWQPDLKAEFFDFELINLEKDDDISFDNKTFLKRGEVNPENYERYFAAYVEGDLSPAERVQVEIFVLDNPPLKKELELMKRSRLQPDLSIVYPFKNELKRHHIPPLYVRLMPYAAVAAVVLFFVTLFFFRTPGVETRLITIIPSAPEEIPVTPALEEISEIKAAKALPVISVPIEPQKPFPRQNYPVSLSGVFVAEETYENILPQSEIKKLTSLSTALAISSSKIDHNLEERTEFAYWHLREREPETKPFRPYSANEIVSYAFSGLKKKIPENTKQIENILNNDRQIILRELAYLSFTGINSFLGNPLNIESKKDDESKTTLFAIGGSFEVFRKETAVME